MASLKNRTLQGVLFDWDGTLINSYAADSSAYLAMFREMGIPWGLEELAQHYSPNWYRVYRAAKLPRARWDDAEGMACAVCEAFASPDCGSAPGARSAAERAPLGSGYE